MIKPTEFREQRTILQDTQYEVDPHFTKGPQSGSGILTTGRVVWLAKAAEQPEHSTVKAFADGIGVVSVKATSVAI